MDYSPLGSSVQGILQARILQWVVLSPGDLLVPGIELRSSALQADSLLSEPPRKPTQKIRDSMWTQILCDSESCDHTYCLDAQSYLRLLCSYKEVLLRSMWTNLATQGQPYPWAKYSFTPLTGVVQIIPTFHLDNVFLQSSGWLLSASVLPGPALFSLSTKSLCFSCSLGQEHLSLTGSLLPQTLTTLLFRYVGTTKPVRIPLCSVIQALSSPGQFCQSSPLSYLSSVMEQSVSYSA